MAEWRQDLERRNHKAFRNDNYWRQLSWRLVNIVLSEWLQKLESFEWSPISVMKGETNVPAVFGPPFYFTHVDLWQSLEGPERERQIQRFKDKANLYIITKKLYKDHGWPDKFRQSDFEYTVAIFAQEYQEASDSVMRYRRRRPPGDNNENRAQKERLLQFTYSELLRNWAGNNAV
jgi:hypothetical protein